MDVLLKYLWRRASAVRSFVGRKATCRKSGGPGSLECAIGAALHSRQREAV